MPMRPFALACLCLSLLACAEPRDGRRPTDAELGGDHDTPPIDLGAGVFRLDNVSESPGTISHDGAIAVTDDGEVVIAFAEPDAVDFNDQDIVVARLVGTTWQRTPRTADTDVQNAFPWLVASGNAVHLVFSGYPGGDNDIFYSVADGADFGGNQDLTSASDGTPPRSDYHARLALTAGGEKIVAFLSYPTDGSGQPTGPSEVRILRFVSAATPSAPVAAILPAGGEDCADPNVAVTDGGVVHVLAACGPAFAETPRYANDESGSFVAETLGTGPATNGFAPSLALDPDGSTLHATWMGDTDCGGQNCTRAWYSRRVAGAWTAPVRVAATAAADESLPLVAVDPFGRVLVAFHRMNAGNMADVYLAFSADGVSFAPERCVTPGTDDSDEWMPYAMAFSPVSGAPQLTYVAIVPESDPVDTEVMRALLVP